MIYLYCEITCEPLFLCHFAPPYFASRLSKSAVQNLYRCEKSSTLDFTKLESFGFRFFCGWHYNG